MKYWEMMISRYISIGALFCVVPIAGSYLIAQSSTTIMYDSSDVVISNPERGFSTFRSSALTDDYLSGLRADISVVQRIHTIPQYIDAPIDQFYLDIIKQDFDVARAGGIKLVLRFSYTNSQSGADAPLAVILDHLEQLEPLLTQNADVIAYIEAGFIGAWGEWYYSSNGLNNTADRRTVLEKILDVLPSRRMVAVRTPEYKRDIFNITDPLTAEEAFSGTNIARIGAHNDCFLASADDYGTYVWNGIESDKEWLNLDNRFVPQGGETCNDDITYTNCENALLELGKMRWSVLNKDYHPNVLNRWESNDCMDEIKRRLGYRFRLLEATLSDSVRPGGVMQVAFSIVNDGWASPYNPRNVDIILQNSNNGARYIYHTAERPGLWMSADTNLVEIHAGIPATIATGSWQVMLHLSDPEPRLQHDPAYSIQLANAGLWGDSTGYNRFNHSIVIASSASGEDNSGDDYFQELDISTPDSATISIEGEYNQPMQFRLVGNYPNPFNGETIIRYNLLEPGDVSVTIFNLAGKEIEQIPLGTIQTGTHEVAWRPQGIASGIYLYSVNLNGIGLVGKLALLK